MRDARDVMVAKLAACKLASTGRSDCHEIEWDLWVLDGILLHFPVEKLFAARNELGKTQGPPDGYTVLSGTP